MFNKTADQTAAPTGAMTTTSRNSNSRSTFASDLRITGEVTALGDIEMAGEIDGNVVARGLTVTAEGRLNGTVRAETVEVRGKLEGQVAAGTFTLRASAQVAADVAYKTLVIESGAQIEGSFSRPKG